ncbi:hypothetical protein ACH5RR_036196 [Cinchona calisaya]|uniref:Uncharacterized protein n=1 Tax=Cinchona calisaya TaxID=153742 RepID=A0ABD2Y2I0_9GENT
MGGKPDGEKVAKVLEKYGGPPNCGDGIMVRNKEEIFLARLIECVDVVSNPMFLNLDRRVPSAVSSLLFNWLNRFNHSDGRNDGCQKGIGAGTPSLGAELGLSEFSIEGDTEQAIMILASPF